MIGQPDKWKAYLITFMFNSLPGSTEGKLWQMTKEIEHFYTNLITRIIRKPSQKSNLERCPRLVAFPDLPVSKGSKTALADVAVNDGLHFHGVLLVPVKSRLKCDLKVHINANRRLYIGNHGQLRDVHLKKIAFDPKGVSDYVFKLWKRNPEFAEWLVVLPRSQSELAPQSGMADARMPAAGRH